MIKLKELVELDGYTGPKPKGKFNPAGMKYSNKEAKSFASEIMAKADSVQRQVKYGLNSFFEPPRQSFITDIGTFIPSIFSEIVRLRNQGLEIEKLPFMEILKRASDPGYESSYYNSQAGLNRQYMWSPRLEFTPGIVDLNPQQPGYIQFQSLWQKTS